ncbi:MAG: serine/threonine-protein kinase, partial [Myxococcota bacterium]
SQPSDPQRSDSGDPSRLLDASAAAAGRFPAADEAQLAAVRAAFPELSVERCIGEGGMATVYRAVQPKLRRTVALKILKRELAEQGEFQARFEREARALASLDHPRILRVIDFGERDQLLYLVTDYVEGADLRRLLELGQLSPEEALRLVPQICEALRYAHMNGVVHRDIKPENILVDMDGNVRIADFGLARMVRGDGAPELLTRSTQVLGTPHYMAPEQWRADQSIDHRADIFSLGVVLYELLTGKLPIGDFTAPSEHRGVPGRLDGVVRRALAQDPDRRYQQVQDLEAALGDESSVSETPDARRAVGRVAWAALSNWRQVLQVLMPLGGLCFAAFGTLLIAVWLSRSLQGDNHWRQDEMIVVGALNLAGGSFCGIAASYLLVGSPKKVLHELNALAVWVGPMVLFSGVLLREVIMDRGLEIQPWGVVVIAGVLFCLAVAFLLWRVRTAGRRAGGPKPEASGRATG